ncbi:MAG: proline--tRNA ligase [Bacteroidia bacterium]|nr:proline--tRNA ligase [Bacteroidia bacterium]
MAKGLTSRSESFPEWYNELVRKADLAENSAVRGCMVIKPYGFAIWELMRDQLDKMFKETGHVNAYFPLFIPKSYLSKEAQTVEGFAKECAVVTHHRLMNNPHGEGVVVDPDSKLEEELIVRPTSETIIWSTYKNWIQSYRDLPILINQWANVVRWELRPRLFLRTAEFLWQEGHTAHATADEAIDETLTILDIYKRFAQDFMAVPVLPGVKPLHEKFPGAVDTYTIEALMQDGKALQSGTSHFLGQTFAKAFDVTFLSHENKQEYVWASSWGVSTRLMGALIMTHSDDEGLVLPPLLAPFQVVLIPLYKKDDEKEKIMEFSIQLEKDLRARGIRVKLDQDEQKRPGWKFAEWELKGVPIRIAIGSRDMENNQLEFARRDTKEKFFVPMEERFDRIEGLLKEIQDNLFNRALKFREENTFQANSWEEFQALIEKGGFVYAHWDGTTETADKIKDETKATIRCIPEGIAEVGKCIYSGKESGQRVVFAKAY